MKVFNDTVCYYRLVLKHTAEDGSNSEDIQVVIDKQDISINPDDVIHTLYADDSRLKLVGEELANDTGRRILNELHRSPLSISEIAKLLDISIQIASYHIARLESTGLVTSNESVISSKGKEMRKYQLTKMAVMLVLYPPYKDDKDTRIAMKRLAAKSFLKRIMMSVAFASAALLGIVLIQDSITGTSPALEVPYWYMVQNVYVYVIILAILSIVLLSAWHLMTRSYVRIQR